MFNKIWDSRSDIIPLILIVFLTFIIGFYEPLWIPVCILLIGLLYYYNKKSLRSKEVRFNSYLDTVVRNIERTNHHAVQNLDIGMAVFAKDGKLQWKNELFSKYVGTKNLEGKRPEDVLPLPANAFGPWRASEANTRGWQLMTPEERIEHQSTIRGFVTLEECRAYQVKHHQLMEERARQRDKVLPSGRQDICAHLKPGTARP